MKGKDISLWATLFASALVGLGCVAHAAQMSFVEEELYVDLGKETLKLFSSPEFCMCQENTSIDPVRS